MDEFTRYLAGIGIASAIGTVITIIIYYCGETSR